VAEHWVINASPVILLSKAGVIHLLPKAGVQIAIPASVVAEVARGKRSDEGRAWLAGDGARFIVPSPSIPDQLQDVDLGLGETEVLAWALAHAEFTAVLDDHQGRVWAQKLNLGFPGSLGAVVFLKRKGLIPVARPAIEQIRSAGAYVSNADIKAALSAAGES
jgi:predicted nucleic acid-binding protein